MNAPMNSDNATEVPESMGRWWQFSLRSLLVVTLVVSLLLGRYGMRRLEVARERAALAALQQLGADAQFHDGRVVGVSFSGAAFQDEAAGLLDRLPQLQRLVFIETSLSDAGLGQLAELEELRHLLILGAPVTDQGLTHLPRLRNLRTLRLDHTRVSNVGLERLGEMQALERLDLVGTQVDDAGLIHLASLSNLKLLYLHETLVTEAGVADLRQRMPGAKILH